MSVSFLQIFRRTTLRLFALALTTGITFADETEEKTKAPPKASLADVTEASLTFREAPEPKEEGGVKRLEVILHVKNTSSSWVDWPGSSVANIQAELLDDQGKPAATGPQAASISHGFETICLPHGSSIDWLVSHEGISFGEDVRDSYILCVGGRGWLIPISKASRYTLHLKVVRRAMGGRSLHSELLIDVPATKVEVKPAK